MALRITVLDRESSIEVTLAGRHAEPWVVELSETGRETAPCLENQRLSLALRDLIYSNEDGKQVLREIVAQKRRDSYERSFDEVFCTGNLQQSSKTSHFKIFIW